MASSDSVKRLIDAEAQASSIIEKAKKDRVSRLKEAKFEAEQEIANYRTTKQEEFVRYTNNDAQFDSEVDALEKKTEEELQGIKGNLDQNKGEVLKMLIDRVLKVNLEVPDVMKAKISPQQNDMSNFRFQNKEEHEGSGRYFADGSDKVA